MDRSLWLLLWLRVAAGGRRLLRSLRSWKGLLFMLVGTLCFLPAFVALFMPGLLIEAQGAAIERHGPLAMFLFCLLNVLLSTGERSVYYTRAEIAYLFSGPYRPRQVLLYKLAGGLGGTVLTSLMLTLVFSAHARWLFAAFIGIYLSVAMIYLFTISISLVASTIGALAFDRRRKLVLAAMSAVIVLALAHVGEDLFRLSPLMILQRMEESPAARFVVTPFVPFVRTFTAGRLWPDLVKWSAAGLAIDAAMVALVLALSGGYYEASVAASGKVYDRLRRARLGEFFAGGEKYRFGLPMPPWLGGAGPVAWRQLTTATRSVARSVALVSFFVLPVSLSVIFLHPGPDNPTLLSIAIAVPVALTLLAPSLIGFDFRPDLARMEVLKTLPVRPWWLALGQLAAPVLLLTVAQWLALGAIVIVVGLDLEYSAAVLVLAGPVNILLLELENLFFLWYPAPLMPANSVDFQTLGRQTILMLIKAGCVGLAMTIAAATAAAAYFLFRGNWTVTIGVACGALLGFDLALLPLLSQAFMQFDVASDRPE